MLPYQMIVSGVPQNTPPKKLVISIALCYCSELDCKTLLLKILYIWIIKHREIKMVPTWKLYPCWLAFMQGLCKGEKSSIVLPSMNFADYKSNRSGKTGLLMQWWYRCYRHNQPLSHYWLDWKTIPHDATNCPPSKKNLWLARLYTLGKNTVLLFYNYSTKWT